MWNCLAKSERPYIGIAIVPARPNLCGGTRADPKRLKGQTDSPSRWEAPDQGRRPLNS